MKKTGREKDSNDHILRCFALYNKYHLLGYQMKLEGIKKEEEDKKAELNSEIWKKYEKKEAKNLKKIFITIFLLAALIYVVKFLTGFV